MRDMKEKINSQSGVSILFALLAFLLAAMISLTIVNTASSMMKRVYGQRQQEQNRLTLTSAANLLKSEMEKTSYTVEKTDGKYIELDKKGIFQEEMKKAVDYLLLNDNQSDETYEDKNSFTIEADNIKEKVNVSLQMDQRFFVIFELQIDGSDRKLYLTMKGRKEEDAQAPGRCSFSWQGEQISVKLPD